MSAIASPLRGVLDDHPAPPLRIRTGRRLVGDVDALDQHVPWDRSGEIEPLADAPGGGQDLVGGQSEMFDHDAVLLLLCLHPFGGGLAHLSAVVADPLRRFDLQDHATRRVEELLEDLGALDVVAADRLRERWVEPVLGLLVVADRAGALVGHRLVAGHLRSGRGDDDAHPGVTTNCADAGSLAGCGEPELPVDEHVGHDHTDRPALLVRPDERALVLGVEHLRLVIVVEAEHGHVFVVLGMFAHSRTVRLGVMLVRSAAAVPSSGTG